MKKYLLMLVVVVPSLYMAMADDKRLYPLPLPAGQMLMDLKGNLVTESDCKKKLAKCVAYVRKTDPTFDAFMNPLVRAFGTTQGAFLLDKCMHVEGVEMRLLSSGGGVWDEYIPPPPQPAPPPPAAPAPPPAQPEDPKQRTDLST